MLSTFYLFQCEFNKTNISTINSLNTVNINGVNFIGLREAKTWSEIAAFIKSFHSAVHRRLCVKNILKLLISQETCAQKPTIQNQGL